MPLGNENSSASLEGQNALRVKVIREGAQDLIGLVDARLSALGVQDVEERLRAICQRYADAPAVERAERILSLPRDNSDVKGGGSSPENSASASPSPVSAEEHQEILECCCQRCVDVRGHAPYKANDPARQKCVYLAARYSRHEQMRTVRDELVALGYGITSRWIEGGCELSKEGSTQAHKAERTRFATEDWSDMLRADTVINFTEEPRTTKMRGGRHVEFGGALALGKRVIVIGHRENVFHCLPTVEFYETWQQCLNHLKDNSVPHGTAAHTAQSKPNPPAPPVSKTDEEKALDLKKPDVNTGDASKAVTTPNDKHL